LLGRERGEGLDGGIFAEEFGGDAVYVDIGRLRGKNCCEQKFPGARVGEGAGDFGIELVEALQNF